MNPVIDISVVLPVYNEEENLPVICRELGQVMERLNIVHEIIFVDDRSTDNSFIVLCRLRESCHNIKVVKLKKRSGQSIALLVGMSFGQGAIIITLDADLQNDPADIPKFIKGIEENYDLVCGWRRNRNDPIFTRVLPSKFGNFFLKLYGIRVHDSACTFKAYKKAVAKKIAGILHNGMHRFIPFVGQQLGISISEIEINHRSRLFGRSNYNFTRVLKVLTDFIILNYMFSRNKIIFISTFLGFFALFFAFLILANKVSLYFILSVWLCLIAVILLVTLKFLRMLRAPKDICDYVEKLIV